MGPLEGIRVLDFGQVGAAPVCGVILGELGADVIKIEKLQGETMRSGAPEGVPWVASAEHVDDPPWMSMNQGKRGLAIDTRRSEGKMVIERLIRISDVMLHNFRPGVMSRLGLDYAAASKINPRIIYLNLYPYGETGPKARWAGGDAWIQGINGNIY